MIEVEERYKEKLTPERIAEDLDFSVPVYLVGDFVLLAILFPAIVLIFQTILSVRPGLFPLGLAVRILLLAEVGFYCLSQVETILLHRAIRMKKFRVEVDRLVEKCKYPWRFIHVDNYNPSRLTFSRFGKYYVRQLEYYPWSENFTMFRTTLFSASDIGEDFIVVLYPYTKKIAMIYSTRVFTYSPES